MSFKLLNLSTVFILLFSSLNANNYSIPSEIKAKDSFNYDSVFKIIDLKKNSNQFDSTFFSTYQVVIKELTNVSPVRAIQAGNTSLEYAKKLNLEREIRDLSNLLGTIYWKQGVNDKALDFFTQALDLSLKFKDYEGAGYCYSDIGNIHYAQSQYDEARQTYLNAIDLVNKHIDETNNGKLTLVILFCNVGLSYGKQDNSFEAIKNFKIALDYAIKNDYYINIATTYKYIGNQYVTMKDYKNAVENFNFSINYFKLTNSPSQMAETYQQLGECYYTFGFYDKALEIHLVARKLLKSLGYSKDLTEVEHSISKIYYAQGKYHLALEAANYGLYLSKKENLLNNQKDFYLLFSEIYEKLNDNKQALYYYKLYNEIGDKIFNSNIAIKTAGVKFKLDLDKKNQELKIYKIQEELQTKTTIYLFIILIILSLVAITLVILYNDKHKTAIKLTESELKLNELNIAKDKFFTIIAHDLKSPISALRNIIDLMLKSFEVYEKEEMISTLDQMSKSSNSVYNLLENLLLWSRIQSGKTAYHPDKFDLSYIINDCVNLFALNLKEKSIELVNNLDKELVAFFDVGMVQTVARNLISNAIKFTYQSGKIIIDYNEDENFYIISIKDSGMGMSQEIIDKLFRIDSNHTSLGTQEEKGTGLGLVICKDFIELNKGKIWVESQIHIGSTFYFSIPKNNIS